MHELVRKKHAISENPLRRGDNKNVTMHPFPLFLLAKRREYKKKERRRKKRKEGEEEEEEGRKFPWRKPFAFPRRFNNHS